MGNSQSNIQEKDDIISFLLKIDSFAAKYLFDPQITHSTRMGDVDYCDNLVIMTSDIISKNLSTLSIEYLAQRTEKGLVIDAMDKEKVIYLNKSELSNLDEKNKTKKRRLCIGIAKFYVKIAQLYTAILKTINPVYIYTNSNKENIVLSYKDKKKIPEGFQYRSTQINLCNSKINALLNGNNYTEDKSKEVKIEPNICKVNLIGDKEKRFMQEEGMVEFEKLFYDVYNYDIGIFDKMSDDMKKRYQSALKAFYNAYTGSKDKELPKEITKFSHIPLRAYHKTSGCKSDGVYKKSYKGTLNDSLFEKYALHLKDMYNKVDEKQKTLLNTLKQVFKVISNSQKQESVIINPELNYKQLEELIVNTQEKILDMYTTCENDFLKGFEIYQEIVIRNKDRQAQQAIDDLKKQEYYTTHNENNNQNNYVNNDSFLYDKMNESQKEYTNYNMDNENTEKANYYKKMYEDNEKKIKELEYKQLADESEEKKRKLQFMANDFTLKE